MSSNDGLQKLVSAITASYRAHPKIIKVDNPEPIDKAAVIETINKLQRIIFPGYFGPKPLKTNTLEYHLGDSLEDLAYNLEKQLRRALPLAAAANKDSLAEESERITYEFLSRIPQIRSLLATDAEAFFDGDPAATGTDEIILSYPGFYALMVFRLAHELYTLGVPMLPRLMTEHAHSLTGIDINPGAVIGHHFFMDHGTGIVVGETTAIGNYVKLYQGVTLGALSTRGGQSLRGKKRHPTIEDNVTIYAGASILGGKTTIGAGSVIGSNAFVTSSVPPNSRVVYKEE